jgi:Fe-S cluster biosynthesis and repair protein YggX
VKVKDLLIEISDRQEIKNFVEQNHYSKSINGVKSSHCFSIKHDDKLVGAIIYGQMSTTAWKKFSDKESDVIELRRLVLIDECPRNSESRVIGQSLRWIKKHDKKLKLVVSYADPNYGHTGVIYRASNFKLIGMSGKDNGFQDIETGKLYHSRGVANKVQRRV